MARTLVVLLMIAGGAFAAQPARSAAADDKRPNVLLIVADDLGYADLGCFGGDEIKTPHLDQLATVGVRLTNFYVAWPACTPSRGALLTGRSPQRNGLYDMIRNDRVNEGHRYTEIEYSVSPEMTLGLDLREITIAKMLHESGYRTGIVGKWDSGRAKRFLPPSRGFDFFYGFANTGIDYYTHERYGIPSMFRGLERTRDDRGTYTTSLFRREALRFLGESKVQPFFFYFAPNAPHIGSNFSKDRYQVPAKEIERYYPEADANDRRVKYMAMVSVMDRAVGDLLALLKEQGRLDNTLVIFLSDNGGGGVADNGPLRGRKGLVFEGGIRVPCIVSWPGHLPAGKTSEEFLTSLEIFPTILAATGTAPPKDVILDGFNLLPVLNGEEDSHRHEMFWQRRLKKAARVGNWKWIKTPEREGLFHLAKDVGEKHDLSQSHPRKLKEMRQAFADWKAEMQAAEPRGPFRNY